MKYSVLTFGCRVNQSDSFAAEEQLLAHGAQPSSPEESDVVLINTCSVTASADQAARQTIRRITRVNPAATILVTGCYATRRPDEVGALSTSVRVVSNEDKPQLLTFVRAAVERHQTEGPADEITTSERFGAGDGSCGAAIEPGTAGRTAFTLQVQTGCSEPCSYCIIPATRGRPRSVPIDRLLAEVDRVTSAGFKEIALTGVHLGSYGRDLDPSSTLLDLLRALSAWVASRAATGQAGGDVLFRISSLEPMDCSPALVELVAGTSCLAPHFHLPLQHASNRILAAMRRPYTIDYFRALAFSIRSRIPHASIGSDVIVGFPGESDDDFSELVAYLESSPLTHLHVFPYSDRPGTVASAMAGKVPGGIVRARAQRIREIGQRLTKVFRESQIGTVHRGLTLEDGSLVVTGNYLKVRIAPGHGRNEWLDVRVSEVDSTAILGSVVGTATV